VDSACPAYGSASIWAEARRTKIADIVALQGHTVGVEWHVACKLQIVMCARKARR